MSRRRFTPSLHPRGKGGKFTSRGGAKSSSSHSGGITYSTKRHTYPFTQKSTRRGGVVVLPVPTRALVTNAHIRGKLVGQTNTRISRSGAIVEQIQVDKAHQGKGIAKTMLANQQKHLGGVSMRSSTFRSDDGERLARKLHGDAAAKRVVNKHTVNIGKNMAEAWTGEQEFFAWQYNRQQKKASKQKARTVAAKNKAKAAKKK